MVLYALTIFLGAFLLFQVQPMIGKFILPWFGGGSSVWTTCMLFFQWLLLGGYLYSHLTTTYIQPKTQAKIHLGILALALFFLPIVPSESWKPLPDDYPTIQILLLLVASMGIPYFVLSTTGPLVQRWFNLTHPNANPYRLYALSNVGSLLALLSYPFLFEPTFSLVAQSNIWSITMGLFAICCGTCAWRIRNISEKTSEPAKASIATSKGKEEKPSFYTRMLWVLLPGIASALLLASTNKMCLDVASFPFLWILPLCLYLLTFIICFDHARWYLRSLWMLILIVALCLVCALMERKYDDTIVIHVLVISIALFSGCMVCHGELYRLKPKPNQLTGYFLLISLGGALGGLIVAVGAPVLFDGFYEYHLCLALLPIVAILTYFRDPEGLFVNGRAYWSWAMLLLFPLSIVLMIITEPGIFFARIQWDQELQIALYIVLVFSILNIVFFYRKNPRFQRIGIAWDWIVISTFPVFLIFILHRELEFTRSHSIELSRNFYGAITVFEHDKHSPDHHHYLLMHGATTHGIQVIDSWATHEPTTYYTSLSGIAQAMALHPKQEDRKIGVIGLGTGSMATLVRSGDILRIYEIDPAIRDLATSRFTYIEESQAHIELVMGDARLSMEKEEPQDYDFLVLDAFSSDAIPLHLVTQEAFAVYLKHLKTDGAIVAHVSNRFLNLEPVVASLADDIGFETVLISNEDPMDLWYVHYSDWVIITKNKELLDKLRDLDSAKLPDQPKPGFKLWTDDYSSLFQIIDWTVFEE